MIRTRLQGATPFFPNMLNNGKVEVCLKEDVDKTLAEKDKVIAELKAENVQLKKETEFMHSNCKWDAGDGCARLLGEKLAIIDEIVELKHKLSEKDKVIADLEESHKMEVEQLLMEIVELKKQVHDYTQGLYVIQAMAEKEARHQKWKRCLAMAMWCERKRIDAANYRIPRQKWDFYDKWHKRWLELAEKFKDGV